MNGTETRCPIWGTPALQIDRTPYGQVTEVDSPRATGRFSITDTAARIMSLLDVPAKVRLTNWLLEQHRHGEISPRVDSNLVNKIRSGEGRSLSPIDRFESLLVYLEASVPQIGGLIKIGGTVDAEYQRRQLELLGWTASHHPTELYFLVEQAVRAGFIERRSPEDSIRLTLDGYNHLASLRARKVDSAQAFVAMWFDDSMSEIYELAIEPAVREAGYNSMRIDRKEHSNKIDDEIVAEIRRSRFLIADFTSEPEKPRGGVYFEAGFAFGLNIPVVWTCRSDLIAQVHFDTRQYNHIVWKDGKSLRAALLNRIVAVVGPGPLLNPQ